MGSAVAVQAQLAAASDAMRRRDFVAAEAAVDAALADDSRNLLALIIKGDCRGAARDGRAASAFFQTALEAAAALPAIPEGLRPALDHARAQSDRFARDYEDALRARLRDAGFDRPEVLPRLAEAVDIATGKRGIYLQQPESFYFPGLPQIQFYNPGQFEWAERIEGETEAIRTELAALVTGAEPFRPYVEADPSRPPKVGNPMLGDPRWGACYLWQAGEPVPGVADKCPRTIAALDLAPIPRIAGRSPMALFSRLQPGMHIPPHHGFLNTRLICHLPLIVPAGCSLRVGNETRAWEEGRMLIFDDSIEHEAWNRGAEDRIVLLFEVWRPEIIDEERAALTVLFETISGYEI